MSAINTPHPDEADEAAAFFENGEADPKPEGLPTLTPEEQRAGAEEYRERQGEPLERAFDEPVPEGEEVPEPLKRQEELRVLAEREKAEAEAKAAAAAADPTPPTESDGPSEDPTPDSSGEQQNGAGGEGRSGGPLEREYLVFQRAPLTEQTLKYLLRQIEEGNAPEPRVAFFELARVTTRTVNVALAETYATHQETLGPKCDMAAVSARSFQVRHVEPKQKVETALSIT